MNSERVGTLRAASEENTLGYNPTNLTKYCSKPLVGLARFARVKTSDAARRRPYVSSSHAYVENPVFQTHFHDYPSS